LSSGVDVLVERDEVDRVALELGVAVGDRSVVLDLGRLLGDLRHDYSPSFGYEE